MRMGNRESQADCDEMGDGAMNPSVNSRYAYPGYGGS